MKILTLTLITAVSLSATANADHIHTPSGLLLGIYASPSQGGMRVNSTIPGYSAQGVLYNGDILLQTTVDGFQFYQLRSAWEMENAKMAIGSNQQAAVEFFRPGVGMMYAWVEFMPIYAPGIAAYSQGQAPQPKQFKAQFKIDKNARKMFLKKPGTGTPNSLPSTNGGFPSNGNTLPKTVNPIPVPLPKPPGNSSSAASLFNR